MERRVVVLDGYSLLFRAFHALPLMDNGEGEYTNAIHGFMLMLQLATFFSPDLYHLDNFCEGNE